MSADELEILLDVDPAPPRPSAIDPKPVGGPSGWTIAAWVLLAGLVLWQFRGCASSVLPIIDGGDKIAADGPALLVAVDAKNMDRLTDGQAASCNSQRVQTWCESNDVQFRRYDVADDLKNESEQWQKMMDAAKAGRIPNWVAVDKNGRGSVIDVPASVDDAIKVLERRFK